MKANARRFRAFLRAVAGRSATSNNPALLTGAGCLGNRLAAVAVERPGTRPQNNAGVMQRLCAVCVDLDHSHNCQIGCIESGR